MVTKSLDPETPEEPGKPNSEEAPEYAWNDATPPPEETQAPVLPKETPGRSSETGDYISEIRQSLASEESNRSKRGTGSLIRRITGSLRRVTGPLRSTDELRSEKAETPPEPEKPEITEGLPAAGQEGTPAAENLPEEMTDELLSGRLAGIQEEEITDDRITGQMDSEPARPFPNNMYTRPLDSDLAPEIPDDLFTNRFGDTESDEAPTISLTEGWNDLPDRGSEAGELLEMEEEPAPTDDSPISLLESGAIAAMGMAEEEMALGDEQDWMREIRAEAQDTGSEKPQTSTPGFESQPEPASNERPSFSGGLRNFIANILGRSKEKQSQPEEAILPDELFSDRLERSLGAETEEKPATGAEAEEPFQSTGAGLLEEPFPVTFQEPPIIDETSILEIQPPQEKAAFFEGLEVNFADVGEIEPSEEINGYELYPEDEALLWGTGEQPAAEAPAPETPITPEDIWGAGSEGDTTGFGSDLRREIWGDAAEPEIPTHDYFSPLEISNPDEEDTFAATYLTGTDFLPPLVEREGESGTDKLLSQALEETGEEEETSSVEDLRSIALEDYEEGEEFNYSDYTYKIDWGDEDQVIPVEAETARSEVEDEQAELWAEEADAETREALSKDWKSWFTNRKTAQKILIIEAAVAVVVMVLAIPYFLFLILRGPMTTAAQPQTSVLPAGVPYPTGLTLPGGWYFPLEKSTYINGKWQPSTSEWLEGSELRRVVAIPWNPQTEAVIQTFQEGDGVELYLNNNKTLKYRVISIGQVEATNTQIFSGRNPSLVIILYQEKEPKRWVIICKP